MVFPCATTQEHVRLQGSLPPTLQSFTASLATISRVSQISFGGSRTVDPAQGPKALVISPTVRELPGTESPESKTPKTTPNHPKPPQTTPNHPKPPQTTPNQPKPAQTGPNHPKPKQKKRPRKVQPLFINRESGVLAEMWGIRSLLEGVSRINWG